MADENNPIETVTVEATRLVDWPKFLLYTSLWVALLAVLDRGTRGWR